MNRRHFLERASLAAGACIFADRTWAKDASAELTDLSIAEAGRRIQSRQLTSMALVQALLARIDIYTPNSTPSSR